MAEKENKIATTIKKKCNFEPNYFTMEQKEFSLRYTCYDDSSEMKSEEVSLINQAKEAIKTSYSPYSKFAVGAAVKLANGQVVLGSNQENAAYPSGLCAERVALFAAAAQFPGVAIDSIAITVESPEHDTVGPIAPCGACRQVMIEYEHLHNSPMKVIMCGEQGSIVSVDKASSLLPFDFHADQLKK